MMNSWILFDLGATVEQFYGTSRMLVIYFVSTITGFLVSAFWSAHLSVGASAALMGLVGAMIAVGVRDRTGTGAAIKAMYVRWVIYILLFGFVALNNFLFFRQADQMAVATLRPMLDRLPWLFLLFVPAITMRALAEDLTSGTYEVVLAQPLTELELLVGKYVGQLLFIWIMLALTFFIPLGLSRGADLQAGVMVAQHESSSMLKMLLRELCWPASSTTRANPLTWARV